MASTYSELKFELIGTGEQSGTWGTTTNTNIGTAIQEAITGSADVTFSSADVTVTLTDTVAAQTARNLRLNLTGTTGGARNLILGSGCQIEKLYLINNGTADTITVKNTTGTGIAVPAGKSMFVYNNATNVVDVTTYLSSLTLGTDLAVADGGTGSSTLTLNNVILGNGTSAVQFVAPGTNGNILTSNGTTWTSAVPAPGGIEYVVKTSNYTTQDNEGVLANTTGGAFTVTLPATPSTGAQVVVADPTGNWGTNNLTIGRNGSTIAGVAQDLICDISGASVQLVYSGTTWAVYAQVGGNGGTVVTLNGVQTLTNKTINGSDNTLTNISLTTAVTGTLPVANGGTGAATLTANNVILGNGTSAVQFVAPGANGNVLTSNGTTWTSALGSTVTAAANAGSTIFLANNFGGF